MNDKYTVSVITPFYNGNKYMKNLFYVIEENYNVLKEKYPYVSLELLIVNDSPNIEVKLSYTNVHFKYSIINHEHNSGIHQARVTGLKYCNGDYILFLDQDDELEIDAIAKQLEKLFRCMSDIVVSNAYMEKNDGSKYLLYRTKTDYNRITDLMFYLKSHNVIKSPGQCLIKKQSIPKEWKEYIMNQNGSDDLFLWILMLEKRCSFSFNNEPLYTHKYTGENLSESEVKMTHSSLEIARILDKIDYIPEKDVDLLKRSREFVTKLKSGKFLVKLLTIIKNIDLFSYLAFNKIKRYIY